MRHTARRTKIVATLGPATDTLPQLEALLLAGVNVVRLNFSHGSPSDHHQRANQVRELCEKHDLNVAILADLQGPKIRIGRFHNNGITLKSGDCFTLDANLDSNEGTQHVVGIDYKTLPEDCRSGDILLLDDGRISLKVDNISGSEITCTVIIGGELKNNKGINRQGGGLSAPALTQKDIKDIAIAAELDVDYVAVSFPKSPEDIIQARELLEQQHSSARIVAKIERAEAALDRDNLDSIISASDAVMVARGDLGVEIGDAELVGVQKHMIKRARVMDKLVIVATQMMESMIENPIPTRAEVFDVANAVLDGADAVMLSAETAAGEHPIAAVEAMHRVCVGAEKSPDVQRSNHRLDRNFQRSDESIAMATMYTANNFSGIKAIICLTESGDTPLLMSRISSGLPIIALTRHPKTKSRMALCRGITSYIYDPTDVSYEFVNEQAIALLKEKDHLQTDDLVILTKGARLGVHGSTNAMLILKAN
ncbi:pyruvate kinase [Gammaproteobacteria bacterium 45_16_T64]|nr:pyruvate kinase [Gammaproteobacteria bacterium 45_16_T64]